MQPNTSSAVEWQQQCEEHAVNVSPDIPVHATFCYPLIRYDQKSDRNDEQASWWNMNCRSTAPAKLHLHAAAMLAQLSQTLLAFSLGGCRRNGCGMFASRFSMEIIKQQK